MLSQACALVDEIFVSKSDRISWDEHAIVTIDGNIVKDSNISDLINITREKNCESRIEISLRYYSVR